MYLVMLSLMERFVCHKVLQENSSFNELMKIDITEESNFLEILFEKNWIFLC